ncbi:MAG: thiolase family protein [Armatimonadetes bacterium]|nr:thiolase family protein [Armatimonadota bacterium]
MKQNRVFLAGAVRTPIGKFGGILAGLTAVDLAVVAAREALKRTGIPPEKVDGVIFGHARQAGCGPNPGRQIAFRAGVPVEKPAYTVNQACGSSLRAIFNACQEILMGNAEIILVGGTESMSNTPYMLPQARWGYRMGHSDLVDGMYKDGFLCPLSNLVMGETAENLARKYGITREEQDRFAVMSQNRYEEARKAGRFQDEMVPVETTQKGKTLVVDKDEHPRDGATLEGLAKLPPVFSKDGTVHAGNSSGITDGASAMVVLSEKAALEMNLKPMAAIVDYTICGVDPSIMGIGPVPAIRKLQDRTGVSLDEIPLIEMNEAFAAQVIACLREIPIPLERVNVNGGAIALGHPIGCTGARIVTTLLHEMGRRKASRGMATLCISGGMGMALLLEAT